MSEYPIYQRQERLQHRTAKPTVVDWAGAMEKMTRSINEGIRLGLDINRSRENSLQSAQQIKESEARMAATNIELGMKSQEFDNKMAHDQMQELIDSKNVAAQMSSETLETDKLTRLSALLNARLNTQQTQRETQANAVLTQNDSMFNDMQANAINVKLAMETTNDPSIRQQNLDLLKEDVDNFQAATGMELTKMAMSLKKDDPRAPQLAMLNPILAQKQYLLDMLVPIQSSVMTQTDYDASNPDALAAGRQNIEQTKTSTSMVPLSVARSYWQAGKSLDTFTNLRDNAADPASFDKWAKESGLGKLVSIPTPVAAAPLPAPIAPLTPVEAANPIITEKASDQVRSLASQSPLEKETGSVWNKLRASMTSKTAAALGLSMPGSALAIAPIIRNEADGVKWIADKTGLAVPQATALRDKIREWLPKAEDAQNQFNADPAKVDANNQYWNDQKAALTTEMQTAAPQRQKVIQKALDLMTPVATPDASTKDVATRVTQGTPVTVQQIDAAIAALQPLLNDPNQKAAATSRMETLKKLKRNVMIPK